VKGVTSESMLV